MQNRVDKYKEYRASLVKEGSVTINDKTTVNTGTLPLEQVINKCPVDETIDVNIKKEQKSKVITYILLVLLLIAVVVGVIILGIFAFRS